MTEQPDETAGDGGPETPAVFRPFVVAVRVLLLVLAAGAATVALLVATREPPRADGTGRYTCPMHPEVRAATPGECPICRMTLEPVSRSNAPSRRELAAMPDLAAVENVRKHNIVDFVRKRSPLFNGRELRGPAWIDDGGIAWALFYKDQVDAMGANEAGVFTPTRGPKGALAVRRTDDPPRSWDRSTTLIRFRIEGSGPAGEVGWLELAPRPREVMTVPASAVIQSPEGPYVLAWVEGFSFEKRPIEIAETFYKQGYAVVLSGLRANERVIARATFFLEADRRINAEAADKRWVVP